MKPRHIVFAGLLSLLSAFLFLSLSIQAAVIGDEHWDNQFGPVGVNDVVYGLTILGNKLYVAGDLNAAGNTRAARIAGYDGANWFPLNKGIIPDYYSVVFALTSDADFIYAGGVFTNADNTRVYNVARWDGTNWSRMGSSINGYVHALKKIGTNLYAAGAFIGPFSTSCLARWTGTEWSIVGGNFYGGSNLPTAYALESDGTNIFLGGDFGVAGGTAFAVWNGVSWSYVGSGIPAGIVRTLFYQSGRLYVGGAFTNSSGSGYTNLAVWNGSDFRPWFDANGAVRDIISFGTNIYVSGEFSRLAGQNLSGIARFDGKAWFPLGTGIQTSRDLGPPGIYKMSFGPNGFLYVAGNFKVIGGTAASHIAAWDGTNWLSLGAEHSKGLTQLNGTPECSLAHGRELYVGGSFAAAGDKLINGIMRWNGTNWSKLGEGLTGSLILQRTPAARALAFAGSDLYAGGNFTYAGGVPAKGLARWDGTNWFSVGDATAPVQALLYNGSMLFVGGTFGTVGDLNSPGLAVYVPGGGWLSIGILAGGASSVLAFAQDGTNIYIGGNFTSVNGQPLANIARWNGSAWFPLGDGVNSTVTALTASNGVVYAGGPFSWAGGVNVNNVARWNGSAWEALGSGLRGIPGLTPVSGLLLHGNDLYAAGAFTDVTQIYTPCLARWDGTTWSYPFGSGLMSSVRKSVVQANTLAFVENDLYVGGDFIFAGDKPSMFFARWNGQINFYPTPQPRLINQRWTTNGHFGFRLEGTSGEPFVIESTTNLDTWTPLITNSAPLFDFTDTSATNAPGKVYRAVIR